MTIVEIVDAHQGFKLVTDNITTRKPRTLLWVVSALFLHYGHIDFCGRLNISNLFLKFKLTFFFAYGPKFSQLMVLLFCVWVLTKAWKLQTERID